MKLKVVLNGVELSPVEDKLVYEDVKIPFYCRADRVLIWVDDGKLDDPDFEKPVCPYCKKYTVITTESKAMTRQRRIKAVQEARGFLRR